MEERKTITRIGGVSALPHTVREEMHQRINGQQLALSFQNSDSNPERKIQQAIAQSDNPTELLSTALFEFMRRTQTGDEDLLDTPALGLAQVASIQALLGQYLQEQIDNAASCTASDDTPVVTAELKRSFHDHMTSDDRARCEAAASLTESTHATKAGPLYQDFLVAVPHYNAYDSNKQISWCPGNGRNDQMIRYPYDSEGRVTAWKLLREQYGVTADAVLEASGEDGNFQQLIQLTKAQMVYHLRICTGSRYGQFAPALNAPLACFNWPFVAMDQLPAYGQEISVIACSPMYLSPVWQKNPAVNFEVDKKPVAISPAHTKEIYDIIMNCVEGYLENHRQATILTKEMWAFLEDFRRIHCPSIQEFVAQAQCFFQSKAPGLRGVMLSRTFVRNGKALSQLEAAINEASTQVAIYQSEAMAEAADTELEKTKSSPMHALGRIEKEREAAAARQNGNATSPASTETVKPFESAEDLISVL